MKITAQEQLLIAHWLAGEVKYAKLTPRKVINNAKTFLEESKEACEKLLADTQLREYLSIIEDFFKQLCMYGYYCFTEMPSALRKLIADFEEFIFAVWKATDIDTVEISLN